MPEVQTNPEYQKAIGAIMGSGVGLIIVAVIGLIEGVVTFLSSKQNKLATLAIIITAISLVVTLVNNIYSFANIGFDYKNILSLVVPIVMDIVVIRAALVVRKAYVDDLIDQTHIDL